MITEHFNHRGELFFRKLYFFHLEKLERHDIHEEKFPILVCSSLFLVELIRLQNFFFFPACLLRVNNSRDGGRRKFAPSSRKNIPENFFFLTDTITLVRAVTKPGVKMKIAVQTHPKLLIEIDFLSHITTILDCCQRNKKAK